MARYNISIKVTYKVKWIMSSPQSFGRQTTEGNLGKYIVYKYKKIVFRGVRHKEHKRITHETCKI